MTNQTSELIMRNAALEARVNELEQLVLKLQQRLDAAEQSVAQKWF